MLRLRLVLALALAPLAAFAAQAEEARLDTAGQHHEWARKFDPAVAERSKSPARVNIGARLESFERCGTSGVIFSGRPLAQWRADLCG